MADYIDRNEVLKWKETITTDDYSGNEIMDVVAVEKILDIEPADVVERSKVNKAIEEITELFVDSKIFPSINTYNKYSEGLEDCLEVLKRNLEDSNK